MNPTYSLAVRIVIGMHKEHRNVTVELKRYIDFVPLEGMKVKFTNEDEEELDIELINLHYDYSERTFVEWQQDDTLADELKQPDRSELSVMPARLAEYLDYYKSFGFEVI